MHEEHARRIDSALASDALVIDVGGGMAAFPRADWIIDAISYDEQGKLLTNDQAGRNHRFTRDTWVQFDLCSRQRWPFDDKQFDFAVCSHVLEDLRDPIWVCSEMSRIAKAGYVEVPSRVVEQSKGIEHPNLAGYYHHRWLVSLCGDRLEFRQKPPLLHVTAAAIVAKVGFWKNINPLHAVLVHYWHDELICREVLDFDEQSVMNELCQWSQRAKSLPELLVRRQEPLLRRVKRAIYYWRLARG